METWKIIKNFPNYEVSSIGNVRNRITKKHLKQQIKEKGYKGVILHKDKKKYNLRVHRLVAIEFIENPELKPYVNHKNGKKCDNNYTNLEWVTPSQNNIHAVSTGLVDFKSLKKAIVLVDILTFKKIEFESITECEKKLNINGVSFLTSKKQIIKNKYISFYKEEINNDEFVMKCLKNTKAVQLFDVNNNLISEFYNISDTAKYLNTDIRYVSNAIIKDKILLKKYIVKKKWS